MLNFGVLTLESTFGTKQLVVNPVIFFDDSNLLLCDTGYPDQNIQIEKQLNRFGFSIKDITKIFITHHDHDHIGSLHKLKNLNKNIEVISSSIEAPYIDASKKSLRLIQAEEFNQKLSGEDLEFGIYFVNYLNSIYNCNVDKCVNDGEYILPGLKIVATPGHTPGHVSLFDEFNKIFIAGDALALENNKLMIANPEFALDLETCIKSIDRILELHPNKIVCYHGGIIDNNINALLREIINT